MTTMTIPAPSTQAGRRGLWRRYGGMWRRAWREALAIAALFAISSVALGVIWGLVVGGIGLLPVLLIGGFLITGALLVADRLGSVSIALLDWTGLPRIPRVIRRRGTGFMGWLRSTLGATHYWLALVYWLLPAIAMGAVSFVALSVWLGVLAGAIGPVWSWRSVLGGTSSHGGGWALHRSLSALPPPIEVLIHVVVAVIFVFGLPFVTRGLVWAHRGVARLFLGAFRSEALAASLASSEASRAAAVAAEDSAIRRLERDIHDGPQQRLVRLQMDLASAERRLGGDPDGARDLIASASEQAREALEELRAVSRGIAPPILLDRGLVAALESAATRSAVPASVVAELPAGLVLRPELERNAYFIASEAMTNAVKHAGATRVEVRVSAPDGDRLLIEVRDDGRGGARSLLGHGLAGLEDRAHGLGGILTVSSPAGGPTIVTARLPIRVA